MRTVANTFRILAREGKLAPGGAFGCIINGRMIAGFARVARAAEYDANVVITFVVRHNGKVHEKNLGKDSTATRANLTMFDSGAGWKAVRR